MSVFSYAGTGTPACSTNYNGTMCIDNLTYGTSELSLNPQKIKASSLVSLAGAGWSKIRVMVPNVTGTFYRTYDYTSTYKSSTMSLGFQYIIDGLPSSGLYNTGGSFPSFQLKWGSQLEIYNGSTNVLNCSSPNSPGNGNMCISYAGTSASITNASGSNACVDSTTGGTITQTTTLFDIGSSAVRLNQPCLPSYVAGFMWTQNANLVINTNTLKDGTYKIRAYVGWNGNPKEQHDGSVGGNTVYDVTGYNRPESFLYFTVPSGWAYGGNGGYDSGYINQSSGFTIKTLPGVKIKVGTTDYTGGTISTGFKSLLVDPLNTTDMPQAKDTTVNASNGMLIDFNIFIPTDTAGTASIKTWGGAAGAPTQVQPDVATVTRPDGTTFTTTHGPYGASNYGSVGSIPLKLNNQASALTTKGEVLVMNYVINQPTGTFTAGAVVPTTNAQNAQGYFRIAPGQVIKKGTYTGTLKVFINYN